MKRGRSGYADSFTHSKVARTWSLFSTKPIEFPFPLFPHVKIISVCPEKVVQKLRWRRNKDLDDARDLLAVQGTETLDMAYIEHWCGQHGTLPRLQEALAGIPPLD